MAEVTAAFNVLIGTIRCCLFNQHRGDVVTASFISVVAGTLVVALITDCCSSCMLLRGSCRLGVRC